MSIISVIRANGEVTTDVHMYTSGICISFLPLPAYGTDTEVSERKKPHKRSAWLPLTSFLSEISMRRRKHRTESEWNCAGVEGNLEMALFFSYLTPLTLALAWHPTSLFFVKCVCVFVTFNYFQKKFLNSDKKVKPAKRSGDYYLSDQGCQCESLNEIMFVFWDHIEMWL